MIAGLKSYPAMKDSGVEWLGQVPEHWETRRVKSLSLVRRGASPRPIADPAYFDNNGEYAWVRIADVTASGRYLERTTQRLSTLGKSLSVPLQPGSLFLSIAGSVGKPIIANIKCCIHDGFVYFPQFRGNAEFLRYIFESGSLFARLGKLGTQLNLNTDTVGNIFLGWPPEAEQAAIVRFLDYMDHRIRLYIRAKQRLIKLLEEQKQAIIHRAVTRGLDPNAPMKDSGVEWLGKVPEHWEISRVKKEFRCLNSRRIPLSGSERGKMTSRNYDYYGASGVIDKVDEYIFDDELLLIAEDGANLVLRNLPLAIIARGKFWVNNHAHILKPRIGNIEYLAALMEALNYSPWISGAAQPKLTKDRLMSIKIVVPPRPEQDQIIAVTNELTVDISNAIKRNQHEFEILREYRTRLIADVVTGKLDVRAAAANLPDEADEPEPLEELDELTDHDLAMDDELDAMQEGAIA